MTLLNDDSVVVVTVSEQLPFHGNETDVVVFSTMEKANAWIEEQIALHVRQSNPAPKAVDDWFLEFEDAGHTIQYDAQERNVL